MSGVSVKDLCYEVSGRVGIVTGGSSGLHIISVNLKGVFLCACIWPLQPQTRSPAKPSS